LRTLGKGPALAVLLVDVLKGVAAILLARWLYPWLEMPEGRVPWTVCLCGLAVLLGHSRSVWLGFTGGKSAATGLGVLLALSWPVGVGAAAVFALVLALARIVSLGTSPSSTSCRSRCPTACWSSPAASTSSRSTAPT